MKLSLLRTACVAALFPLSACCAQAAPGGSPAKTVDLHPTEQGAVRFISWNVQFGCRGTPEEIGDMLNAWHPDVVAFNEVPGGDWTERVGKRCGMKYAFVGKSASADMMGILYSNGAESGYFKNNHPKTPGFKFVPNKFKSILSRTPLTGAEDVPVSGLGWKPAGAVRATTVVGDRTVTVYSLHISGDRNAPAGTQAEYLATRVLSKASGRDTLVMGDFNNRLGPVMDVFKGVGFANMWEVLKVDTSGLKTWSAIPKQPSNGVIDHILFNHPETIRPVQGGIIELEKPLSDHKPVWGDFRFGSAANPPAAKVLTQD